MSRSANAMVMTVYELINLDFKKICVLYAAFSGLIY
jgi:hypothetical protein